MLPIEQQAIIREIWNNRFNIHSLRPLQSKVTRVTEDHGVLKFHVEHQCIPTPLPFGKDSKEKRKRELRYNLQPLQTVLQERGIRTLSVTKQGSLEEAVKLRLSQLGIHVNEITIEKLSDKKPYYSIQVLKSPCLINESKAKLNIYRDAEDLLNATFVDGDYHTRNKSLSLQVTSYPVGEKYFYASIFAMESFSRYLKINCLENLSFAFYNNEIGAMDDYQQHLTLLSHTPVIKRQFSAGESFELRLKDEATILTYQGEEVVYPALNQKLAILVSNRGLIAKPVQLELTSMEP